MIRQHLFPIERRTAEQNASGYLNSEEHHPNLFNAFQSLKNKFVGRVFRIAIAQDKNDGLYFRVNKIEPLEPFDIES